MINVTKTFLPKIEEYGNYVKRAFDNHWLTNRGELVKELELILKEYLGTKNIILLNNGTTPLQIALKLLGQKGEIITTPFSYVATTSSIIWENCTPVFVDIDPEYLTIDENKIEAAITEKTTCILATHVFGNACNIESIDKIAKRYNLKVIYDAAHCFGVKYLGKSIFSYGDVSTCSFHATKIFHTAEGGAFFSNDETLFDNAILTHMFGHIGDEYFLPGINGKMSELHAAMGLAVLPYMGDITKSRSEIISKYNYNLDFSSIQKLKIREGVEWNHSYYPIIFPNEEILLKVIYELNSQNIFPRRYFYPSLNTLPYVIFQEMAVSEYVSKRILCLPLFVDLKEAEQFNIIEIVNRVLK